MTTLNTQLRNTLERTVVEARKLSEIGAKEALESLAVHHYEPYEQMSPEQRRLRNHLRVLARQLGDTQDKSGRIDMRHIIHECAYEYWHRMLFARFLAENDLLIDLEMGVSITLAECEELARDVGEDKWVYASHCAQDMLPQIFRPSDPLLQVPFAINHRVKLEALLDGLARDTFTATDAIGWVYQFWQSKKKDDVNASGKKIGADELPAVTQLFTEDYMVDFLLDNTLGAWWAGKVSGVGFQVSVEEEARRACALPGCEWKYLRFIKQDQLSEEDSHLDTRNLEPEIWIPAAGTYDGWPKTTAELKCLDPCCGSGHFLVAMLERLVPMRMAEEGLSKPDAVRAVLRDNIHGLEIDPRCTQLAAFALALATWRCAGHAELPRVNIACSGLAPNAKKEDWMELADDRESLRRGMKQLYDLFEKAPVLGSLINPRALRSDLLVAGFDELQPVLKKALAIEDDDNLHEMAVTAQGIAKAAEILGGEFTLVATNVPYLGRGKQDSILQDYCERVYPESKADLATCFVERSIEFCENNGTITLVSPQTWISQTSTKKLREKFLEEKTWVSVARLGPKSFQTPMWDFNVMLVALTQSKPNLQVRFLSLDVSAGKSPEEKASGLLSSRAILVGQSDQSKNPDSRIVHGDNFDRAAPLSDLAISVEGMSTGDSERYLAHFWTVYLSGKTWDCFQRSPDNDEPYCGERAVVKWENGEGTLSVSPQARVQGHGAWGKRGILVSLMGQLNACLSVGAKHDKITAVIVPKKESLLLPIWTYCSSSDFHDEVRKLNPALQPGTGTLIKVPFDLDRWQKVAADKYPNGLPKPFSSDPTQWLFSGHPKDSDQPLQVAVARLLGYRWPRQTGSSFPDCPALEPDGLEKLEDKDGIVCIPSVRGEETAANRLLAILRKSYGNEWNENKVRELIAATASKAESLDDWLRNDFFKQHCKLFHHRPFIWHIWDGRKRDGFHALVNYHKLSESNGEGRKVLEKLTHSYLGDWITRQKDGVNRGEGGADDRLAAATELQKRLLGILEGEPPFDIFVRWKPLHQQPIGWTPDINDGVRLNIRPFMASDLPKDVCPGARKGAGILRYKPNIKWKKDRGKEPQRPKEEYPWFWSWDEATQNFMGGTEFDGNRWNDLHYTNAAKEAARRRLTTDHVEEQRE